MMASQQRSGPTHQMTGNGRIYALPEPEVRAVSEPYGGPGLITLGVLSLFWLVVGFLLGTWLT